MAEQIDSEALAVKKFIHACMECQTVFVQKNFQYGNSIADTGAIGAIVTLIGDTARVRKLVLDKQRIDINEVDWEKVREVLLDIHNYATIGMMMIDDNNLTGENSNEEET